MVSTYTQPVLSDSSLDAQLLQQGYVVVPFLTAEEVEGLTAFFYENHPAGIPGFYASAHVPEIGFRQKMNNEIRRVFERAIQQQFVNCTALGGSFVVKSNEQKERLHPHQDWNIVDEDIYRSFNIWVPLVNLTDSNGVIRILPGSHSWMKTYRGPNIPDVFGEFNQEIWQQMVPLYMKAGEALIYDHRLFHASDPNTTDRLRLAAVYGIKPAEASMYYYYGNNNRVEVYESSVQFFLEGNIQQGNQLLPKVKDIDWGPGKTEVPPSSFFAAEPKGEADGLPTATTGIWQKLLGWLRA